MDKAARVCGGDRGFPRRYVTLARSIASRYNVRLTKKDKTLLCRRCNSLLVPGASSRVRTHDTRVVITCLECGSVRRVPFSRERKGKLNKRAGEKSLNQINR